MSITIIFANQNFLKKLGTDNNIPLKGINNVFHSSLFEGTSSVLIEYTVNLLIEHKSLFLFGTN